MAGKKSKGRSTRSTRAAQPPPLRPNELALIGVGLTIFLLALGALVGIAVASLAFGDGWSWPAGVDGAARRLGDLLTGRLHDPRAPSPAVVWTVVVLVELAVLAGAILFARWAGDVVRPAAVAAPRVRKGEVAAAFGRRSRMPWSRSPAEPGASGWRLGRAEGVDVWLPFDGTVGVIGPAASGKTLDVVTHAALAAPGPLVLAAPKPDDALLSVTKRGEPMIVFDPLGAVPGLPAMAWDPLHGCVDSTVATRRAKAFCAGPTERAGERVKDRDAAAKVLQCYFHAAALTGRTIDHVLTWVADPVATDVPETILREHPHAEPHWADLLHGTLRQRVPTATMQQAMDALLHKEIAQRVLPNSRHPATDIAALLGENGTVYLVGQDDPVVSLSPLLTAVVDDIVAAAPATTLVVLDGPLPLPAPPPRLIWAAPEPGPDADVLVYVGEVPAKVDVELHEREAVVLAPGPAPGLPPFVVKLQRSVEGKSGAELLAQFEQARERAATVPDSPWHSRWDAARSALVAAHERGLHPDTWRQR